MFDSNKLSTADAVQQCFPVTATMAAAYRSRAERASKRRGHVQSLERSARVKTSGASIDAPIAQAVDAPLLQPVQPVIEQLVAQSPRACAPMRAPIPAPTPAPAPAAETTAAAAPVSVDVQIKKLPKGAVAIDVGPQGSAGTDVWSQPIAARTFLQARAAVESYYQLGPGRLHLDIFTVLLCMPSTVISFKELCDSRNESMPGKRDKLRRRLEKVIKSGLRLGMVEQTAHGIQKTIKGRQFVAAGLHSRAAATKIGAGRYSVAELCALQAEEELAGLRHAEEEHTPERRTMTGELLAACLRTWNRVPAA